MSARQQQSLHDGPDARQKIQTLFGSARDEVFEDGMESEFAKELQLIIRLHGNEAMEEIYYLISHEKVKPETAAEALRWLGLMQDANTYSYRLALLERSLRSPIASVRDGALLGLSFTQDRKAVPHLKRAIERETIPQLRRYMERVLGKLERAG